MTPKTSTIIAAKITSQDDKEDSVKTPYSSALARLEPIQPLLKGITHRNRNQHRRAAWWSSLGMLRRNNDKLITELIAADSRARTDALKAAKAAKSKGQKRRREELLAKDSAILSKSGNKSPSVRNNALGSSSTTAAGRVDGSNNSERSGEPIDETVIQRATWLRDVLIPKCHLAFSQLTADGQFATLGVVLLGALAQVHVVCSELLPNSVPSSSGSSDHAQVHAKDFPGTVLPRHSATAAISSSISRQRKEGSSTKSILPQPDAARSVGKTISRDAVEHAAKTRKSEKQKSHRSEKLGASSHQAPSIATTASGASRKPLPDEHFSTLDNSATPTSNVKASDDVRPAKKMKMAPESTGSVGNRGKDKERAQKKKKMKKGDEFDDLFKGLF
ncbi:hypothetical protein F5Y16DRAFT_395711 [Xylariaceae sp. FL0255]|nr:hypothetical protein F5Y16DRAFT_395711 [Xylariaceae sp. FL0255]